MPPAKSYWIIVAGNTPTAFRAREEADLIPTLRQLQRTQSNVTLAWFERNRLWTSPAAAEENLMRKRREHVGRTKGWRPGGAHSDPKERRELSRDQRRELWKKRQRRSKPGK